MNLKEIDKKLQKIENDFIESYNRLTVKLDRVAEGRRSTLNLEDNEVLQKVKRRRENLKKLKEKREKIVYLPNLILKNNNNESINVSKEKTNKNKRKNIISSILTDAGTLNSNNNLSNNISCLPSLSSKLALNNNHNAEEYYFNNNVYRSLTKFDEVESNYMYVNQFFKILLEIF